MSIIASKPKTEYSNAPEGLHQAVCCDVVDLGMQETGFDGKKAHKVQIRWQLDQIDPKSKDKWPYMVTRSFRLSLHEKASLRAILESWRGRKFTPEELEGFDLEKLIGVNCQVQILHNVKQGGETYANVQAIVPAPKNAPKLRVTESYIRVAEREKRAQLEKDPFGYGTESAHITDEDIPF
jgi:hypothetical protein